jgi:hypothetical protein
MASRTHACTKPAAACQQQDSMQERTQAIRFLVNQGGLHVHCKVNGTALLLT